MPTKYRLCKTFYFSVGASVTTPLRPPTPDALFLDCPPLVCHHDNHKAYDLTGIILFHKEYPDRSNSLASGR